MKLARYINFPRFDSVRKKASKISTEMSEKGKVVGNYQVVKKLGNGSFASVYLGVDKRDGRQYALKAISIGLLYVLSIQLSTLIFQQIRCLRNIVNLSWK